MKNVLNGRKKSTPKWKIAFQKSAYKEYQKAREKIDKSLKFLRMNPFNDALHFRKNSRKRSFLQNQSWRLQNCLYTQKICVDHTYY